MKKCDKFEEAIKCFEKIISQEPDHKDAYYELGYCYDYIDRLEDALKCYDKHLEIVPFNYNAWYNRGSF